MLYFRILQPAQSQTDLNWAILGLFNNLSVHICENFYLRAVATFYGDSVVGGVSAPADISVSGFSTISGVPAVVGVLAVVAWHPGCCADAIQAPLMNDAANTVKFSIHLHWETFCYLAVSIV
jgi:hypothetical protein